MKIFIFSIFILFFFLPLTACKKSSSPSGGIPKSSDGGGTVDNNTPPPSPLPSSGEGTPSSPGVMSMGDFVFTEEALECLENIACGVNMEGLENHVDRTCANTVCEGGGEGTGGIKIKNQLINAQSFTWFNNGYFKTKVGSLTHVYRNVTDLSWDYTKRSLAVLTSSGMLIHYTNSGVSVLSSKAQSVTSGRGGFAWINNDGSSSLLFYRESPKDSRSFVFEVASEGVTDIYVPQEHGHRLAYLFRTSSQYIAHMASDAYDYSGYSFSLVCFNSPLLIKNSEPITLLKSPPSLPLEATIEPESTTLKVSYTNGEGVEVSENYTHCLLKE